MPALTAARDLRGRRPKGPARGSRGKHRPSGVHLLQPGASSSSRFTCRNLRRARPTLLTLLDVLRDELHLTEAESQALDPREKGGDDTRG